MIDELKMNVENEKRIVRDLISIQKQLEGADENDRSLYESSIDSLLTQLKILNDSIPMLLEGSSIVKKLPGVDGGEKSGGRGEESGIIKMSYVSPSTREKRFIAINKKDKEVFAKELRLSESGLIQLRRKSKKEDKVIINKPSKLARVSNQIFSGTSEKLSPKFKSLSRDLKKSNSRFLVSSYISIALFITSLVFISSLLVFVVLAFLISGFWKWIWAPFFLTFLAGVFLYFYPAMEKGAVQKSISQELPFATIHMAAIAGSNIEPTKIFRIIAMSPEYPHIGIELKKLVNQVDIYGYDLVTALKNSAKQTSSKALSELFIGLATNITSGGELKSYLEKKSENYLVDYKLERQRSSALAGTFMDIYISILIAAPLILMTLLVVMNITGLEVGLSIDLILFFSMGGIVITNILFMVFLELKQPKT